jgi:preprotein translocase subunit SecD
MKPKAKLYLSFVGIVLLALAAAWIVHPKGSKIDLHKIKISYAKFFSVHLGLDLQGGSHLEYQADFSNTKNESKADALDAVRTTIERRVNSFGVSEPLVQVSGQDRIIVELPGIKDVNEAIAQIGKTPFLEFKTQNPNPATAELGQNGELNLNGDTQWVSTPLSGKQLSSASVDFDTTQGLNNQVQVKLNFDSEGTKLFEEITRANLQKQVAIFLDGDALTAPTVQSVISTGQAVITGEFCSHYANDPTVKKDQLSCAKRLVADLNSGALPVPIKLISQQNVGATLGFESIQKSMIAGIIGILLIALFMVMYYRFPGLLAVFALIVYGLVSFAIFKIGISLVGVILVGLFFFLGLTVNARFGILAFISYVLLMLIPGGLAPVTLTLAGIAGFILSIGMAVDANILIFERFKEEIRSGKDIHRALEDGFNRAWLSIRDSNVSSLITTVILYIFGTPSIKGFALTLGIGILISMFTAITVTNTFLKLFIGNNIMTHPWLFGVSKPKQETSN